MNKAEIFRKANNEFQRLSGFDLMYREQYVDGSIDLYTLIDKNQQWLLDHVNDVERGMRATLKRQLAQEEPK